MAFKRTTETQTERTATGIITTVREYNKKTNQNRWTQIGYTSLEERIINDKKVLVPTGKYGQALITEEDPYIIREE